MAFRFLHLADLHLETSFGGRPAVRERLRRATIEAFERAVDFALEHRLHAVLAAGDLFDDRLLSLGTELELVRQVQRLAAAGVWFVYCCGNHDPGGDHFRAASLGIEAKPGSEGEWRERVRVFRRPAPETVTVIDRDGRPVGVVVGAGHPNATEGANLASRFPRVESPLPVVGLLHTTVVGARSSDEHDRYAPSTDADYHRLDYSYWALGHLHIRQRAVDGLPVFYAGNLQGRNPRETGEKGGWVVEAHPRASAEPEFVRFAPVRWERLRMDGLPADDAVAALVEHLADGVEALRTWPSEEIAVSIELAGQTPLARRLRSPHELETLELELASRTGALEVRLRAVGVALPRDRRALRESPTVVAHALDLIERAATDDALLRHLAPQALARELPDDGAAELAYLRELLADLPEEAVERSFSGDEA